MKGEQEVLHPPHLPQYIYIGGAPADILQDPGVDILIPKVGLQGCVKHFLLQEREVELFSGAVSGQEQNMLNQSISIKWQKLKQKPTVLIVK